MKTFVEKFLKKSKNIKHYSNEKDAIAKERTTLIVVYVSKDEEIKNLLLNKWFESENQRTLSLIKSDNKSEVMIVENQKKIKSFSLTEKEIENFFGGSKDKEEI
jgi:sensor histidine kinase regulating citrate/malate metabolism